ncbi:hypothetical protein CDIK_4481, partial [Cucumispora dikerogammari]
NKSYDINKNKKFASTFTKTKKTFLVDCITDKNKKYVFNLNSKFVEVTHDDLKKLTDTFYTVENTSQVIIKLVSEKKDIDNSLIKYLTNNPTKAFKLSVFSGTFLWFITDNLIRFITIFEGLISALNEIFQKYIISIVRKNNKSYFIQDKNEKKK